MRTQIHYQAMENTQWVDEFINSRIVKLERFLTPSATIQVHIRVSGHEKYVTSISVHSFRHDHAFTAESDNFYESFTTALNKAIRVLSEEKKKMKDHIHRKFHSVNDDAVA